jgi:hypothetical protein
MFLIEIDKLLAGDIFLTTEKHITSKSIRTFTSSNYSHAILYVGAGSYIHSDMDGVHSGNVQRLLFEKQNYVQVLRLRADVDRKLINESCIFARREIGKQYSKIDAINTKNPFSKKTDTNRQFCSRLVAQSFDSVGIKLVSNPVYCAPQELDDSEYTVRVLNCVRKATDAEIEFANSEDPIKKQSIITNNIFSQVRKITGEDIQTFEQLEIFLLKNVDYDEQITTIIQNSGYLFMWQHELNANPWRYNQEEFMELPFSKEKLHQLAAEELDRANNNRQRYLFVYEEFMKVWQATRLQYALINIVLYEKLLELTDQWINACMYVLEST